MHQHGKYHVRALSALQVLFTRGELAGRNFHYHFVVDRGMPYEVRPLPSSALVRPCMHRVASVVAQPGFADRHACNLQAPASGPAVPAPKGVCVSGASKLCCRDVCSEVLA